MGDAYYALREEGHHATLFDTFTVDADGDGETPSLTVHNFF